MAVVPSPQFQVQVLIAQPVPGDVDVSVTVIVTGDWLLTGVVVEVNPALGRPQPGVGVGVGVGDGVATGVGVGEATGVGVGAAGRISSWVLDVDWKVRSWPPKNVDRRGVSRRKCPVTLTATVLPKAAAHPAGLQVTLTSAGETLTAEPVDSRSVRHITRLVDWLAFVQACPATKEVGVWAAWKAPSRAALETVICA